MLDEFLLNEVRAGNGWWANKFGAQLGAKYVDALGVTNLDLQGEVNMVRPFTYSHNSQFASYTNYFQPIAHPFGANFNEWIGVARYQPLPKLCLAAKVIRAVRGRDRSDTNFGGDPLKNNSTREFTYGNKIGQGLEEALTMGTFTASYQLKHNLFLDVSAVYRQSAVAEPASPVPTDVTFPVSTNTTLLSGTLRWNIAPRVYDY